MREMSTPFIRFVVSRALGAASVSSEEGQVTCGNGQTVDLAVGQDFYWWSPGWEEGDEYPENTECKLTFRVPPRHNWEIASIYDFDVYGDYTDGCVNGDYVQFTVNGKKAKKFCGRGTKLSDAWCWEDWCWPNTFEVVGNPSQDLLVEAVFKSGARPSKGFYSGFEIMISSGYPWKSEKPEVNGDGIPMLPMLEEEAKPCKDKANKCKKMKGKKCKSKWAKKKCPLTCGKCP